MSASKDGVGFFETRVDISLMPVEGGGLSVCVLSEADEELRFTLEDLARVCVDNFPEKKSLMIDGLRDLADKVGKR